jgi:hypothetical protein
VLSLLGLSLGLGHLSLLHTLDMLRTELVLLSLTVPSVGLRICLLLYSHLLSYKLLMLDLLAQCLLNLNILSGRARRLKRT